MSKPINPELDVEWLRTIIKYGPETGRFFKCYGPNNNRRRAICLGQSEYKVININGRALYAHRVAWLLYYGRWPKDEIDHINRDKRDNRIVNLRDVTASQNIRNSAAASWVQDCLVVAGSGLSVPALDLEELFT